MRRSGQRGALVIPCTATVSRGTGARAACSASAGTARAGNSKDIRNTNTIRYVMKNGELFAGDTLEQLWPTPRKLEPMYWWNNEPRGYSLAK